MNVTRRNSLTLRLTLLFALASTVVLLGLGYLIAHSIEQHFVEQDMEMIDGKMELARNALQHVRTSSELAALPILFDESLVGHHGLAIIVISPDGATLFESGSAHFPAAMIKRHDPRQAFEWGDGMERFRGIAGEAITGISGAQPAIVGVATEIAHHDSFMESFRATLWLFVTVAAVLMGVLGWMVTHRSLAPLRAIKQEAAEITASKLNSRLSLDAVPTELAELAETLNEMLARLEESFRRLSDFSSDLAHELRTPISNLMTQTQVSLSRTRSVSDYQDILSSNAEELERMARMVSDMLFLAKADNGLMTTSTEAVALEDEVRSLFEFYEALAEALSVKLVVEGCAIVTADRLMLRRALSNLLSNAIRHADPNSTVRVTLEADVSFVRIMVENTGASIAPEHLPRLFDRFFRADASRQRSSEGAGLGLAITQSIIKAHSGTISASSEAGVTRFMLTLPQRSNN